MTTATGLLKRAIEELEIHGEVSTWDLIKEIRTFLDAEPEAEPVAYIYKGFGIQNLNFITDDLKPHLHGEEISLLYLHPPKPEPARKPMSEEEIKAEAQSEKFNRCDAIVFAAGIRFAEKHHGIRRG